MICKIRVKPSDVLIENRMANMTSMEHTTQLVDEAEGERKRGDPRGKGGHLRRKNCYTREQFAKTISKLILFCCDY